MTMKLIPCANGCTRRHGTEHHPVTTEAPSQLCTQCETRLETWLRKIPDAYALLPLFVEHGTVERNPESKTTKAVEAPAPMRLDIIDLLDERRGRKWLGTEATDDHRGTLGTLWANVDRLADEKPLTSIPRPSVTAACELLRRHHLWLLEQDWIADLYDDIRTIHRQLADATGDYRQKPVGRCPAIPEDGDGNECGGPIFATLAGAHCARCDGTWHSDQLRLLGSAMGEPA